MSGGVAQMADNLVRGPVRATCWPSPVFGGEAFEQTNESPPLLDEDIEQVFGIYVAPAPYSQDESGWPHGANVLVHARGSYKCVVWGYVGCVADRVEC